MNPIVGWALAVLAVAVAWAQWQWQGLALAFTVIVFWLLLQFNRTMRVMRLASNRPVGQVDSAVMLHARLHAGMRMLEILPLTRSLGRRVSDDPEVFEWRDDSGATLRVTLQRGRCSHWTLQRPQEEAPAER